MGAPASGSVLGRRSVAQGRVAVAVVVVVLEVADDHPGLEQGDRKAQGNGLVRPLPDHASVELLEVD